MPIDRSIDPTADQVRALRDTGRDGPVVMLNLLKFKQQATYDNGEAVSGAQAYARYQHAFTVTVGAISQAEVLYEGPVEQAFRHGRHAGDRLGHGADRALSDARAFSGDDGGSRVS